MKATAEPRACKVGPGIFILWLNGKCGLQTKVKDISSKGVPARYRT